MFSEYEINVPVVLHSAGKEVLPQPYSTAFLAKSDFVQQDIFRCKIHSDHQDPSSSQILA